MFKFLTRWLTGRKQKETEIRNLKANLHQEIKKTCKAAKKGDSDAQLKIKKLEESITEQSLRLTGKPKPPTTVIQGGN